MPFFKKAEVQNIGGKYDSHKNMGIVALEKIAKGELIFKCDMNDCPYYPWDGTEYKYTKEELDKLLQQYPHCRDYIYSYNYTAGHNAYRVPKTFLSTVLTDECAFFNHSCSPNVGFDDDFLTMHVALRDIEPGEELTLHYGFFEDEHSLYNGLKCKCDSSNCSKNLYFDYYKNPEFQNQYYQYCNGYIKSKIRELRSM